MPTLPRKSRGGAPKKTAPPPRAALCFGSHLSVAGGLHLALEEAQRLEFQCVQIFVKNQRQWAARPLDDAAVQTWRDTAARTGIAPAVAHASYLVNLASPDETLWERSIRAFIEELHRCDQLGVAGLVLHPGAHLGGGVSVGCRRVAAAIDRIVAETSGGTTQIWLEITAGQGSSLGSRFEEIGEMIAATPDATRIGVCFDTCHALAAGYQFDTAERYAATFDEFERAIGLSRLKCFHLNDSVRECGSRVDRHAHLDRGHVGRTAFARILQDPRFAGLPMILETPKGKDPESGSDFDTINLALLRELALHPL